MGLPEPGLWTPPLSQADPFHPLLTGPSSHIGLSLNNNLPRDASKTTYIYQYFFSQIHSVIFYFFCLYTFFASYIMCYKCASYMCIYRNNYQKYIYIKQTHMYASISSWLLFLIPLDYEINEGRGHFWLCLSSSGITRNTVSAPYRSQCSDWSSFFESTIVAHYLGRKLLDFVFLFISSCSFIQQCLMAPAEKTFESPLDCNEIKPVNPKEI